MRRSLITGFGAALLALVLSVPAYAADENGKVAFTRLACTRVPPTCTSDIWAIAPNGADVTRMTSLNSAEHPAWSFDGQRLALSWRSDQAIHTIREDGTDLRHVLDWNDGIGRLSWSPDGGRLAASLNTCTPGGCRMNLYTMQIDGTELTNITPGTFDALNPAWSPDGSRIAFDSLQSGATNIWTIEPDGTDLTQVTHRTSGSDNSPAWSREGDKIVFASDRDGPNEGSQLFTMKPDGTEIQRITPLLSPGQSNDPTFSPDGGQIAFQGSRNTGPGIYRMLSSGGSAIALTTNPLDFEPDWQLATRPYPIAGRYPRPKSATPVVIPFVPAFRLCDTPNRVHGPPLAEPSCATPAQYSQELTIGAADANGRPTRGAASARIAVIRGNPATTDDEADVSIRLGMLDVYRRSDLSDYAGEIDMRVTVRITDRDNFPAAGSEGGGTLGDMTFRVPGSCVPTANVDTGASCTVDTTLDSITPGTVREGGRAVWQLDQIYVYDGGTDGAASTVPNDPFQVQGVFIP